MTYQLNQRELVIDLSTGNFDIRRIDDPRIVGPVDYGWVRYQQDPDVFTWGGGPLAGSRIPGSRRLFFCAYSPAWEGFYISSLGGGAYVMHRVYVPGFRTGGTFGVNMQTANERLFSFNYQSVYADEQARLDLHQHFILDHYLRQFNQETIAPRNFWHCGEPCSVACKKMYQHYKKDYEPYQALGPLCGVFDQRAAEQLNHYVDAMGFDAIQTGGTVSWVMELIHRGIVPPEDLGLPPADRMRFDFSADPTTFDVVADSARNAAYAQAVVDMILFEPQGEPFRRGIRAAARALDARYGLTEPGRRTVDYAVYTAHGENGCMVPNQYWVPGMFSPMPMMGKYFNYYGVDWVPPRELGHKCVERMVYEFYSDNSGVCRFHRKWAEAIVDEIILCHYDLALDYKAHQFEIVRDICTHEIQGTVFWESERTVDIIMGYLEGWERLGLNDPALHHWLARFRADKWTAARDYWEEIRAGILEALAGGPNAISDKHPQHKAALMDVMEQQTSEKGGQ